MAHELEIVNGKASFATRSEPAWHGLGTVFEGDLSTSEMLKTANLHNWDVRLEKVNYPDNYTTVSDAYSVVRNNPADGEPHVLSVVGERYKVLQNEELFAFGDGIVDGGATWETAGSIKDGRVVFGSLSVPREFVLDPQGIADTTKLYLLVHTSHDGSVSVQSAITPVRVVCQNTLNLAMRNVKQSFKIRHTQTVAGRLEQARHALGLTFDYANEFEKEAQSLFATAFTNAQFDKLVASIYPKPDTDNKMSNTKYDEKISLIQGLYRSAPTQDGIRGTKWGALNALTEQIDYFRTSRTGDNKSLMAAASGFDISTNAQKNKILQAVKAA